MYFSGTKFFNFSFLTIILPSLPSSGDLKTTDSSGEEDSDDEETGPNVDVSSQFKLLFDSPSKGT